MPANSDMPTSLVLCRRRWSSLSKHEIPNHVPMNFSRHKSMGGLCSLGACNTVWSLAIPAVMISGWWLWWRRDVKRVCGQRHHLRTASWCSVPVRILGYSVGRSLKHTLNVSHHMKPNRYQVPAAVKVIKCVGEHSSGGRLCTDVCMYVECNKNL